MEKILGKGFSCFRVDWLVDSVCKAGDMKPNEVRAKLSNVAKRHGFEQLVNSISKDGRHKIGGKNVVVYKRVQIESVDLNILNRELF